MRSFWLPVRVPAWRAVLEAAGGFLILTVLAGVTGVTNTRPSGPPAIVLLLLAFAWLAGWPAWRLRRVSARTGWSRFGFGLFRGIALGILLGLAALLVSLVVLPVYNSGARSVALSHLAVLVPVVTVAFMLARTGLLLLASLRRRVRRRLRWQLMVSHVAVILLTLTTLTAAGSVGALAVALYGIRPDVPTLTRSVATQLQLASVPSHAVTATRATRILQGIENGSLPVSGEPLLFALARRAVIPNRLWLVNGRGKILADSYGGVDIGRSLPIGGVLPAQWSTVRIMANGGGVATVPLATQGGSAGSSSDVLAAAEVYNQGRSSRFVVLDVPEFAYSSRLFGALLAVFGVSTIILILATSLPVLALSFLFSYLVARNLTRRLESVSRVTTAIASGDLGERAPVQSRNEIGTLAENVNSMADHLETTMGALSEARTRAVDALRSRQELVASISHELRTPLAIMKAHLETVSTPHAVAAGALPSSEPCEVAVPAATLRALEGETQRLSGLIEDLFSLSRADAGALQITREAVDVAALLVDIAANLGPLAWAEGSVRLSVEIEPQLPRAVADAARVRQIVANLVRNAVRHTPQGGIIVLSASLHDRWMVVCVADTGEGIAADHMPHIFDPFYRVDEARSRESGGTGLGLAIVDELVELMGGRVTVESTVGEGSVFRVFLPVEGVTA